MVKGSVDGSDRHVVSGWAYDSSRPERPLDVSVFLGDRLLFQTEASAWRDDLAEAGIGDGCHAFFHVLPQPIEEDKLSDISVVAEGQRLALSRSSLGSPSDAYVVGSIERLDRYGVAGWAYNTAAPSHSVSVSILLEDRLLDRLDADLFRSDLEVANIGTGRHAFRYAFVDEVPEHELSKVSVRVGAVCLPRASLIEPFHASLVGNDPASGIDRIRSRARVFPVSLRRTFDIASDSVIGRLMRLLHKEFPPSVERITSMLNDLCDVAKSDNAERLHLEKMSVNFGDRVEQVEVSRTNTHFISVDRGVREYMLGYEPEILASIDLFVPDEGVLLDIGSNWGCFSIFLAARPRFSGRAYAFEPSSRSFQDLVKLVEDLKLKERIVCHKLALADYTGSARLSIGLFSGLSSISDSVAENYAVAYENVQVSRLTIWLFPALT